MTVLVVSGFLSLSITLAEPLCGPPATKKGSLMAGQHDNLKPLCRAVQDSLHLLKSRVIGKN